jgi:hypothetical protein
MDNEDYVGRIIMYLKRKSGGGRPLNGMDHAISRVALAADLYGLSNKEVMQKISECSLLTGI